jgi:hypothetical protein
VGIDDDGLAFDVAESFHPLLECREANRRGGGRRREDGGDARRRRLLCQRPLRCDQDTEDRDDGENGVDA